MEAAGQIFRTLDALRLRDPVVFRSGPKSGAVPDASFSAWHLEATAPDRGRTFPRITDLFLQDCREIRSLDWVESFPSLERLWILGSNKISDLEGIQSAVRLTSLTLWPSMGSSITVESLAPLRSLGLLEEFLFAGKTRDGSLAALNGLDRLKTVFFSNAYRWEEIADFEARHPTVEFPWKGGVMPAANPTVLRCKTCGTPQSLLAGKGLRLACPNCEGAYLARHLARYRARSTA